MALSKFEKGVKYTPLLKYVRDDLEITCIGTSHIGSCEYYGLLQEEVNKMPFGFHEGIKVSKQTNISVEKKKYAETIFALNDARRLLVNYLGLVQEQEFLKLPNSWQNADMQLTDFVEQSSPELLKGIKKNSDNILKLERVYRAHPEDLKTVIKGFSRFFGGSEFSEVYSALNFGLDYKVSLLDRRNEKLFEILELEFENPRTDKLGIVYGANHLIGISKFLKNNNFKLERVEWIKAYDLNSDTSFWLAAGRLMIYNFADMFRFKK